MASNGIKPEDRPHFVMCEPKPPFAWQNPHSRGKRTVPTSCEAGVVDKVDEKKMCGIEYVEEIFKARLLLRIVKI